MNKSLCLAERVRKVSDGLTDINLQIELDDIYDELRKMGEQAEGEVKVDDYGLAHAQAMVDVQEPKESAAIYCPVCGRECEDYILTYFGEISGCDRCTKRVDALTYLVENK